MMHDIKHNKQANQRLKAEAGARLMVKPEDVKKMVKNEVEQAKLSEIGDVRNELKSDISDVRVEVRDVRDELKSDISDVRVEVRDVRDELKSEINGVRVELRDFRDELKSEIRKVKDELTALIDKNFKWTVGIVIVAMLATKII